MKKAGFNDKLKNSNKKIASNRTRRIEVNTKIYDLEKKFKIISKQGLTTDLINKFSILNGEKYFSSNRF